MKRNALKTIITASILIVTLNLYAIDREANMIDTAWVDGYSFDHSDYIGLRVTGENAIQGTDGKWAILAGISGGTFSPDYGDNSLSIGGEIGLKYYFSRLTSVAALGGYTWNDADDYDYDMGTATARLKQRFMPATNPLSPYIKLETGMQFIDTDDSDNVWVYRALLGCDISSTDSMAFILEGGYAGSDNQDDGRDTEDGWIFRLGMQYYWN